MKNEYADIAIFRNQISNKMEERNCKLINSKSIVKVLFRDGMEIIFKTQKIASKNQKSLYEFLKE